MVIMTPVTVIYARILQRYGDQAPDTVLLKILNELGFVWVLSTAYFFLALVFYRAFRESLLTRLTGFKERDEREQLVTGKASRATFLFMLALQIMLLIMSLTNVHLVRNPDGHGTLSIGMGIDSSLHGDLFHGARQPVADSTTSGRLEINRFLLPPNLAVVFFILILMQFLVFRLFSRKYYTE